MGVHVDRYCGEVAEALYDGVAPGDEINRLMTP
jgi:hypothetical protein